MSHRLTLATAGGTILASIALYSLFAAQSWFWAGAGGVVVVAGVGTLTRLRRLPVLVGLAAELGGLLVYLNLLFAASRSWLLVVPNAASLDYLRTVAAQGTADADRFSPPVPVTPGLMLLAAAGIGLAAVAADTLSVRLRRAALAGVPLLALFIVPTTTPVSRGAVGTTIVFALGTVGYLLILWADGRERIRVWGRTVGLWRPEAFRRPGSAPQRTVVMRELAREPDARSLASAGRRVGLASMVVALCLPLVVPGLRVYRLFPAHVNLFGAVGGGSLGTGSGATVPNPVAAMNNELHESEPLTILTYKTTNLSPQYLQMYSLSDLTSTGWTIDPRLGPMDSTSGALPAAPGLTGASRYDVTTKISFGRMDQGSLGFTFLPVPYPPTRITVPGHWQVDLGTSMVFAYGTSLSGLNYTVNSVDVDPTPQQLDKAGTPPANVASEDLSIPASYRSLKPLAERITRNAATPYDKAIALQQWFTSTGGFSYNLNTTEPTSAAGLTKFLTVSKRGYCQQFAFAMAVLARLLGIPARVAVGFTNGTETGTDTWTVKTSDAHAWPQLYFQGAGWLRFEPTPSGVGGQGTASPPTYTVPSTPGVSGGQPSSTVPGSLGTGSTGSSGGNTKISPQIHRPGGGSAGPAGGGGGGGFPTGPTEVLVVLVLVLLLIAPWAGRRLLRRHRLGLAGLPSPDDGLTADAPPAHPGEPPAPGRVSASVAGNGASGDGSDRAYQSIRGPSEVTAGVVTAGNGDGPGNAGGTGNFDGTGNGHGPGQLMSRVPGTGYRTDGAEAAGWGRRRWPGRRPRWSDGAGRTPEELARINVARAHAAWREVLDDLTDYRIGRRPSETPRAIARRVAGELSLPPAPAGALGRLALAEERASYSRRPASSATLRPDVDTFQRGIASSVSRRVRWRARLFPASMIAPLQARLARLGEVISPLNHTWWRRGFGWVHRRPKAEPTAELIDR